MPVRSTVTAAHRPSLYSETVSHWSLVKILRATAVTPAANNQPYPVRLSRSSEQRPRPRRQQHLRTANPTPSTNTDRSSRPSERRPRPTVTYTTRFLWRRTIHQHPLRRLRGGDSPTPAGSHQLRLTQRVSLDPTRVNRKPQPFRC